MVIVGDGAVGRGLAVAFSLTGREVYLAGPPGTPRETLRLKARGFLAGCASVATGVLGNAPEGVPVVCALKAYSIHDAASLIRKRRPGLLISVSNGLGLRELWQGLSPRPALLTVGFFRRGDTVDVSPGRVLAQAGDPAETLFRETALPVEAVPDLEVMLYAKWLVNSVINPLGALTGLPNHRLLPAGLGPLVDRLFEEMAPAVPEASVEPARILLQEVLARSTNRCSMLQDMQAGRPTELPWLTGYAERVLPGRCPAASTLCSLIRAMVPAREPRGQPGNGEGEP